MNYMNNLKAAIGLSRKWNAYEAGKEVAKDALDKLGTNPDFFLLFSTIHYKDHGGFKEFLRGVWDILPEGTPLIGGTVTGFIIPRGCYARGATALVVSYEKMDVAIGYGTETKRNPEKATNMCIEMIKNGLKETKYQKKILFNIVSGSITIKIPGYGYKKVIDSDFLSKSIVKFFSLMHYLTKKGLGREDEIFEMISKKLSDYKMILVSSSDNYKGFFNYQFFKNKVLTNSMVSLGLATDLEFDVLTSYGVRKRDIKLEITKVSKDGHIIQEINNRPAVPELYRILNWPPNFLSDETILNKILYYPLSVKRGEKEVPLIMAMILKDFIVTPGKVKEGEVWILEMSGKSLLNAVEDNLSSFKGISPAIGFSSLCVTLLQTLGNNVWDIRKAMLDYFKEKPFLALFSTGEGTYSPQRGFHYANMSYNTAVIGSKKISSKL